MQSFVASRRLELNEFQRSSNWKSLCWVSKPSDYSEEPAAKTKIVYQAIFKNMRNLKELKMQQPDLQQLGKH